MAKADAILWISVGGASNVALKLLLRRVIAARECESLQHLKDVENIPELIVPETSEGFVGELDVIAREVISEEHGSKFHFPQHYQKSSM